MNEVEAGIDRFNKFGEFNLIYNLAGGDPTKYDAVFNITYSEAFTTLYRRAEETRFAKQLRKIINR
jgi:hypothetical protein